MENTLENKTKLQKRFAGMDFFQPKLKNVRQKILENKPKITKNVKASKTKENTLKSQRNNKAKINQTTKIQIKPKSKQNSMQKDTKISIKKQKNKNEISNILTFDLQKFHQLKSYMKKPLKQNFTRPQSPNQRISQKPKISQKHQRTATASRAFSPKISHTRCKSPNLINNKILTKNTLQNAFSLQNSPREICTSNKLSRKMSPKERISNLGLEFVYLQRTKSGKNITKIISHKENKTVDFSKQALNFDKLGSCKKNKEIQQKEKIREYIRQKAIQTKILQQQKEADIRAETDRIRENMIKLEINVQKNRISPKKIQKSKKQKYKISSHKLQKIIKIQALFRGFLVRKKYGPIKAKKEKSLEINFYGDQTNSKLQDSNNSKILCTSKINPSYIDQNNQNTVIGITLSENQSAQQSPKIPMTSEIGICTEILENLNSTTPIKQKLEFSSTPIQNIEISPEVKTPKRQKSPELSKITQNLKSPLESIIKGDTNNLGEEVEKVNDALRNCEKAVEHRANVEKQYIKQTTNNSKEYYSKRKELEKWVNKEKTEIAQAKAVIIDSWEKTKQLIETSQRNTEQIKTLLFRNKRPYLSYTNSAKNSLKTRSEFEFCGTFDENPHNLSHESRNLKPTLDCFLLDEAVLQKCEEIEINNEKIHNTTPKNLPTLIIDLNTISSRQKGNKEILNLDKKLLQKLGPEKQEVNKEFKEEITNRIFEQIIEDLFSPLFPIRDIVTNKNQNTQPTQERLFAEAALRKIEGIKTDMNFVSDYLDEIFACALSFQKKDLMTNVNLPIPRNPSEILKKLQNPLLETIEHFPPKLPHEMSSILHLSTYLEVERLHEICKNESPPHHYTEPAEFISECDRIHKKLIFDSSNEALNLIRPYGLIGAPMPWSNSQRVLFTQITCPGIIVTNVKNIVIC